MRRPAFQFYPADWRKDAELQSCSVTARGLWHEAMCIMHECEPYGELRVNGNPMTLPQLARLVGMTLAECKRAMDELDEAGVPSRRDDGAIYSRRMVRDEEVRNARAVGGAAGAEHGSKGAEHGHKGGRPRTATGDKKPPLYPPPSSSTSSSEEVAAAIAQTTSDELNRLNRVLGFDPGNFTAHAANIRTLVDLKADGCDFEKHILAAAEQAAKGGKGKSLAYIRPRAIELRDAAKLVASMPAPFENTDEVGWRSRLRTSRDKGLWSSKWGPKPGEDGCKCPPWILKEQQQETAHAAE